MCVNVSMNKEGVETHFHLSKSATYALDARVTHEQCGTCVSITFAVGKGL